MRNFKQLEIWNTGMLIASKSFELVTSFPSEHKFGLAAQVIRASISIPSNIAEGSSRKSEKDYSRFLQISLGSCFELETQILIANQTGLGNEDLKNEIIVHLMSEQKMLMAFMKKLQPNGENRG